MLLLFLFLVVNLSFQVRTTNDIVSSLSSSPKSLSSLLENFSNNQQQRYHIVFSSGCSPSQDWQSYVFFYHAWKSGQMNQNNTLQVTRVASGCTPEQQAEMELFHLDKIIRAMLQESSPKDSSSSSPAFSVLETSRFALHFTPDYASTVLPGTSYRFFNKPFGLQHWMKHGLKYEQNAHLLDDVIFIILDPDQIIMRPLESSFEHQQTDQILFHKPNDILHRSVQHGKPMAQLYVFGAQWIDRLNSSEIFGGPDAAPSRISYWTHQYVQNYFQVGPPYMATGRDMFQIVNTWAKVVLPVYHQTKDHLSEMYAYSVAAGHLNLPHQTVNSFMVSNPLVHDEAWPLFENELTTRDIFSAASSTSITTINGDDSDKKKKNAFVPPLLHYCQEYKLGPWYFFKYATPNDFIFNCQHPLFDEPECCNHVPQNSGATATTTTLDAAYNWGFSTRDAKNYERNIIPSIIHRKRHVYILHHLLQKLNQAATFYRTQHCLTTSSTTNALKSISTSGSSANFNKSFIFPVAIEAKRQADAALAAVAAAASSVVSAG